MLKTEKRSVLVLFIKKKRTDHAARGNLGIIMQNITKISDFGVLCSSVHHFSADLFSGNDALFDVLL